MFVAMLEDAEERDESCSAFASQDTEQTTNATDPVQEYTVNGTYCQI